jgi:AcrR family transcriptional regulator
VARKRLPKEVRKQQILDAALKCFYQKGYHGASIRDIVEASGISKGNLYWHFENKEDVFLAVFDRWCDKAMEDMKTDIEIRAVDKAETTRRVAQRLHRYTNDERPFMMAWLEFVTAAGRDEKVREKLVRIESRFQERLLKSLENLSEVTQLRDVKLDSLAMLLSAMHEGLIIKGIIWPEKYAKKETITEVMDTLTELIETDGEK